jgi:DNA polymerase III subunit delta
MLFFLYGEDDYRSQEKLQQIKNRFIKKVDESGYNIVTLDEKITVEKFTKEFSQTGFLANKKLIIIKNLLKQTLTKDLAEIILEYLDKFKNDQDENIIVFYENNLPHSRKNALSGDKLKLFKKLISFKYSQEFIKLADYKVVEWIQGRFKEDDKNIDQKLANKLLALVGNNLRFLNNEISKIANYNKGKEIEEKSIDELVSASLNDDIFLFSDKLANKKKIEAVKLLNEQLQSGANPVYLLTMIIRQFRILLQIKSALEGNISQASLAKHLSLHPFVVQKSIASARLYSLEELKLIYRRLLNLEKKIKSSGLKPQTLLNLFVLDF